MKFLAILLTSSIYFLASSTVHAIYDPRTVENNKAGVHILDPAEIENAAKLVNSNGGDWGYLTIPIQPSDRDKTKWQNFMAQAKSFHLIPIIRITTIPQGGTWATGHDTDLVDFANFLGELDWPTQNRYIILFNEVNRSAEWGGKVDPEKYASIVKNAYIIFKERSSDFFILGPSLDSALPNSSTSLSAQNYLSRMAQFDPLVWTYFDGWSSHSYPNPDYLASPQKTGLQSIVSYKSELAYLKLAPKPIFITETGWDQTKLKDSVIAQYWSTAWNIWQGDPNVVAVTPFVLEGGDQFAPLSLFKKNGEYSPSGQSIYNLPKSSGAPKEVIKVIQVATTSAIKQPNWAIPFFKSSKVLLKLENIFRTILGLPTKSTVTIKDISLVVELAQTAKQWEDGLAGRRDLGDIDGMLFIFSRYHIPIFWMKGVEFPLDMIWISDGRVVDITHNASVELSDKLPTYSPKSPINMVLEISAGWAKENNLVIGDLLTL